MRHGTRVRRINPFSRHCTGLVFLLVLFFLITTAAAQDETLFPEAPGSLQSGVRVLIIPVVETTLSSEIASRIEEILVDFGRSFKRSQDLIVFDCDVYQAELDKARAEFEEARKTLEVNRRLETLQSISELEVAVAAARMDMAEAEQDLREIQVRKCRLKAPFSGRVVKKEVNAFEYVTPGQPLLRIIDDKNLHLQLFVPSRWLKWIKEDVRFRVRMDETGKSYQARVTTLGSRVDPVSQTLEIRGMIEGTHPELLAGMSGTARFKVP